MNEEKNMNAAPDENALNKEELKDVAGGYPILIGIPLSAELGGVEGAAGTGIFGENPGMPGVQGNTEEIHIR